MDVYDELPYPERARQSCIDLQNHAKAMTLPSWLDQSAAETFANNLDLDMVKSFGNTLAQHANQTKMGGTFESVDQEAGLIVLMHALDFGGGWRQELHAHHGKGAFQTVKPGVEALFEANPKLDASWLSEVKESAVAQYFGVEGSEPLKPFVRQLTKVCNEIGDGVKTAGHETVATWIAQRLETANKTETPAALLVKDLVDAFPYTFDDRHVVNHRPVFLYKKAQLVVGELGHRFQDEDERFKFADLNQLTAFIDNVICAVMRKHGVAATTKELGDKIDNHGHLPSGGIEEVSLRAAAMAGVEAVVKATGDPDFAPCTLGNWLWGGLGKQPDHRVYQRHATKDTVFY